MLDGRKGCVAQSIVVGIRAIVALPAVVLGRLRIPATGAPLFTVSRPPPMTAQAKAGVVGSFPALNARPRSELAAWLAGIAGTLAAHDAADPKHPAAPFALNRVARRSNTQPEADR